MTILKMYCKFSDIFFNFPFHYLNFLIFDYKKTDSNHFNKVICKCKRVFFNISF